MLFIDADAPSAERDRRVDWAGAALVTAALVLITFVLAQGALAPRGWRTPCTSPLPLLPSSLPRSHRATADDGADIIALLLLGLLLLGAFLAWQHYLETHMDAARPGQGARPPLMRLSMWRRARGKFAVMQAIALLQWAAFISWVFWAQVCSSIFPPIFLPSHLAALPSLVFPPYFSFTSFFLLRDLLDRKESMLTVVRRAQLYYQDFANLSPVRTAIRMLPMTITGIACNLLVALVIGRVDVVFLVGAPTSLRPSSLHPPPFPSAIFSPLAAHR